MLLLTIMACRDGAVGHVERRLPNSLVCGLSGECWTKIVRQLIVRMERHRPPVLAALQFTLAGEASLISYMYDEIHHLAWARGNHPVLQTQVLPMEISMT